MPSVTFKNKGDIGLSIINPEQYRYEF